MWLVIPAAVEPTPSESEIMSTLFAVFGFPGHIELIIVLVVVVLLFGNRIPTLMRNMGRGITEFKAGMHGQGDDEPNAPEEK